MKTAESNFTLPASKFQGLNSKPHPAIMAGNTCQACVVLPRHRCPPFGKRLMAMIEQGRPPLIVRILVYGAKNYVHQEPRDPWAEAREINDADNGIATILLPFGESPDCYEWPVQDRICMVEHWPSRGMDSVVTELAHCLLDAGAEFVVIRDEHFNCIRRVL